MRTELLYGAAATALVFGALAAAASAHSYGPLPGRRSFRLKVGKNWDAPGAPKRADLRADGRANRRRQAQAVRIAERGGKLPWLQGQLALAA